MRCNIDAFLNRQKLSSTISPSPHPLLALLPPPTEIIERQRELVALPGIMQTNILTAFTLFICIHIVLPLSQRFR